MAMTLTRKITSQDVVGRHKSRKMMNLLQSLWRDYRRSQLLLSASYHRHPLARSMPRRTWGRHSALFMLMDEERDHH